LAGQEAQYSDIRPGTDKKISWYGRAGRRTQWAVVSVHGFTASRMETAPVSEMLAQALGANYFETRLTGHGRTGEALAEATPQDWMADTLEAARIGRTLGKQVLMVCASTGATLATWLDLQSEGEALGADAYVFLSPNFGAKDSRTKIVFWPLGLQIVHAAFGKIRDMRSNNPDLNQAFTTCYPFKAIFPMLGLVRHVNAMDLSRFQSPVLVLYSKRDQIISVRALKKAFSRLGSTHKDIVAVNYSTDMNQHVLASAIRSPESVQRLTDTIIQWFRKLPSTSL
jgi:esterase/lipase